MPIPKALTIAGSDSGGGAGIQADLKTFNSLSVFGMSVITAVTAQNSYEVSGILPVPPEFVKLQIDTVAKDIKVDGAKTGMLFSSEIIKVVTGSIKDYSIKPVIVDPVMVSKSNARLLREDAIESLIKYLLPESTIVTPNIPEAEILASMSISTIEDMKAAAEKIGTEIGLKVLVKGGHFNGPPIDIYYDGSNILKFEGTRYETKNTHGTGDTLSSAILSFLIKGYREQEAIALGKEYVEGSIRNSFPTGSGFGSLCHWWRYGECHP
ncbi:phosphomethylpyrimidine kinase [Thermoplasma volcanium GSS1]|uniref:Phosphomethylpyrimidine kinase n=1 Tax=Thermoplasma volcanium (strain ATCC 51530 / DSM 4299 / JCM 9571 / NBRC 15438 / GSS1) TaxID=273116 RepID=Q97BE3_THEVO|nr:bifunctional hydroxymethylpyrimidine kinase/phosphomethylpyrimidine kinase [Thermoplasma volcanium]BAB59655.1 phosphomethylpyrimidine kinase [Thermoplasma volcanium GSS1]